MLTLKSSFLKPFFKEVFDPDFQHSFTTSSPKNTSFGPALVSQKWADLKTLEYIGTQSEVIWICRAVWAHLGPFSLVLFS